MKLADKMLDYRAVNNLSIEKAAEACGISAQTWRYVERNLQEPNRITQRKLEIFLKGDANEGINNADQDV